MLELSKRLNLKQGPRPASLKNLEQIYMRDPFIYTDTRRGLYFLYGTSMEICDGAANIDPYFEVYVSKNLIEFEGPFTAFVPKTGFWGVKNYWAPEVYQYKGAYYMFATFKGGIGKDRGTAILKAKQPEGPYTEHSEGHVTLKGHECLDGTLYIENGQPYIAFCHEWTEMYYGSIKALPLSEDFTHTLSGVPIILVDTKKDKIPWIRPMEDSRVNKTGYLTDAPFFLNTAEGKLYLLWSSYSVKGYGGTGKGGYVTAVCESLSGTIQGPWIHLNKLLLDENTGHASLFKDLSGSLKLISHCNDTLHGQEYPVIHELQTEKELSAQKGETKKTDVKKERT